MQHLTPPPLLLRITAGSPAVCADLDTAEAGDACRQAELAVDESKAFKGNYKTLSGAGPSASYSYVCGVRACG